MDFLGRGSFCLFLATLNPKPGTLGFQKGFQVRRGFEFQGSGVQSVMAQQALNLKPSTTLATNALNPESGTLNPDPA